MSDNFSTSNCYIDILPYTLASTINTVYLGGGGGGDFRCYSIIYIYYYNRIKS